MFNKIQTMIIINQILNSIKNYSCLFFFIFLFTIFKPTAAQVVFEESNNDVYNFLERISQRGVIEFDNLIKPIPREYIAEKLEELSDKKNRLTKLERDEFEFYISEYGNEIEKQNSEFRIKNSEVKNKKIGKDSTGFEYTELNKEVMPKNNEYSLFEKDRFGRFRVFAYAEDNFQFFVNPILGFEYGSVKDGNNSHIWNGLQFYGYIEDNIGFEFSFRDNSESGDNLNRTKYFTPETGITIAKAGANSFEYSDFTGSISYSWNWGNVSIAKQQLTWGHEKSGNIVLSDKAPSFPMIRLDIKPVEWFRFNYFHGWLNSDVVDSSSFYPAFVEGHSREIQRNKYIASHTLTLTPLKGLDFSLGESIIYSDELQIAYLFPMMFFRAADHFLHYPSNDLGDNSQFFFSISSKDHIKNTHLYTSLYIDEIRTTEIFNSEKSRNQIAFNIGASVTDLPIENLTIEIEYSRINPFAYIHYIPTLTYQSDSYNLGHWIGHNGDLFYTALNYRFIRGLKTKLWYQSIRKGEEGTPVQQWDTSVPQPEFLFGLNRNYNYYGFDISYEFVHDLFLRGKYQYSSIETEYEEGKYFTDSFSTFKMAIYYGL